MAIYLDGGGFNRSKEEEEREKERLLLGVGARAKPAAKPVTDLTKHDHEYYRERSRFAQKAIADSPQERDDISSYFRLARDLGGEDKAKQRLLDCTSIWRRYYKPYSGQLVNTMAFSPYTVYELDEMAKQGSMVLFNGTDSKRNFLPETSSAKSQDEKTADVLFGASTDEQKVRMADIPMMIFDPTNDPSDVMGKQRQATYDSWWSEWSATRPASLVKMETMTGLKNSDFASWQGYEAALKEWSQTKENYLRTNMGEDFNRAYDDLIQERSRWTGANYGDVEKAFRLSGVGDIATATVTALSDYWAIKFFGGGKLTQAATQGIDRLVARETSKYLAEAAAQSAVRTSAITGRAINLAAQQALKSTSPFLRMWRAESMGTKAIAKFGLPGRLAAKGAALGTAALVTSGPVQQTIGAAVQEHDAGVADELLREYGANLEPTQAQIALQQNRAYIANISQLTDENDGVDGRGIVKAMQIEAQTPQYDENGVLLRPAYGTDLVADGVPNEDWYAVFDRMKDDDSRSISRWQSEWLASGRGKGLHITGSLYDWDETTESWVPNKWYDERELAVQESEEEQRYFENHKWLYALQEVTNVPLTSWYWNKQLARLGNEGLAYAPFKAMLDAALLPGNTIRAGRILGTMALRMAKDPGRKRIEELLVAEANKQTIGLSEEELGMSLGPDDMTAAKAKLLVMGGFITSENAKLLVGKLDQDTARKMQEQLAPGGGSYIELFGNAFGGDTTAIRNYVETNWNFVDGMTVLGDIVGQMGLSRAGAYMRRPVVRTIDAVSDSVRAKRTFEKLVDNRARVLRGEQDEGSHFIATVGGQDANVLYRRVVAYERGADVYAPDSRYVSEKVDEITPALLAGDRSAVKAAFSPEFAKSSTADAMVGNLIKLVQAQPAYTKLPRQKKVTTTTEEAEVVGFTDAELAAYNAGRSLGVLGKPIGAYEVTGTATREVTLKATPGQNVAYKMGYEERPTTPAMKSEDLAAYNQGRSDKLNGKPEGAYKPSTTTKRIETIKKATVELQSLYEIGYAHGKFELEPMAGVTKRTRQKTVESVLVGEAETVNPAAARVAKSIALRQAHRGDIFGLRDSSDFVVETAANMYAGEVQPDGSRRYYNVFPQWDKPGVTKKTRTRAKMEEMLIDMEPGRNKTILNAFLAGLYIRPQDKLTPEMTQEFVRGVKNAVMNITKNASTAEWWATRAGLLNWEDHRALVRFRRGFEALREENLQTGAVRNRVLGALDTTFADMDTQARTIGSRWSEEAPRRGEPTEPRIGEFRTTEGATEQVTMLQTQEGRVIRTHSADVWTPVQTPDDANSIVKVWNAGRNGIKRTEAMLMAVNTPLRIVSVGTGFVVLFQKHSISDTGRTLSVMGATPFLKFSHNLKGYREILGRLDAADVAQVQHRERLARDGEMHFITEGGGTARWKRKHVYEKVPGLRTLMPTNMNSGVSTVRRVVSEEGFSIWAKGGDEAFMKWLMSDEGTSWLKSSNQLRKYKAQMKREGLEFSEEELLDQAAADYVNMRMTLFGDMEATAPHLYGDMVKMARGELPAHTQQIKKSIENAYKKYGENPVIDVNVESGGITGPFVTMTKWGMAPNRFNRSAVFYQQFNSTFGHLKKTAPGITDRDAAMIAADVAQTKTQQIHFDLSQAFTFEMRHRWYAYFATKHRLWNTWLAKTALTKPLYSAAVADFLKWMEDRNQESDEETPEWEKYMVKLGPFEFNPAAYTWTLHYPPQSSMGLLAERGLIEAGNSIFGTDWQAAPNTFGYSAARTDQLFAALGRRFTAPGFGAKADPTDEEIDEYIASLPDKERNRLTEQIATIWATSRNDPGGEKTLLECYQEAMAGNFHHTLTSFLKPASTAIYSEETEELKAKQRKYEVLSDAEKPDFLEQNPDVAMVIGAWGRDPSKHRELVAGLTEYRQIRNEYTNAIETAFSTGQLEDPQFGEDIYVQMRNQVDALKRRNPTLNSWFSATREDNYIKNIKYIFPILDAEDIGKMRVPTTDEVTEFEKPLIEATAKLLQETYGLAYSSTSPLARRIKHNMVEIPSQQFTGQLPSDLTAGERNNYRILAKSQSVGMFRTSQYIEMVTNLKKRELLLAGLNMGKADQDNLLMMFMSAQEKEFVGIASDAEVEKIWDEYAWFYTQARSYLDLKTEVDPKTGEPHGMSPTSKVGKKFLESVMATKVAEWRSRSESWAFQYDLSQITARERMEELGYASGTRPAAKSWRSFFNTYDEMMDTLEQMDLTTAGGQKAATVVREARKKWAKLTKDEAFMREWNVLGLSLSKFGVSKWKLEDAADGPLYWRDPTADNAYDIYEEEQ